MATLATSIYSGNQSTAIIIPSKSNALTISYESLIKEVTNFQIKLAKLGIHPQSAVSIALPNSYEFAVAFLATSWQRAIAAPLNPAYKQDEFEFYIEDLSSALALVPKGSVEQNAPAVRAAKKYNAAIAECYWDDEKSEVILDVKDEGKLKDRVGETSVEKPVPEDIALVLHTSGTTGRPKAVPLSHRNLVRTMIFHALETTFKAPVVEAYAMTEAAHQMTSNPLPPFPRKPGSVGLPQGVDIRILDPTGEELPQGKEGEICIQGENVTKGYINNPEANQTGFTKTGFFRTGDQGKKDEEGYVFITGRIKELINKGGEKISPIELDNVLVQHPNIAEAVTFAVDDEMYGQEIGVAVVLKDKKMDESELKKWMGEKVAKFKIPKKIYFTDQMPKTATGKIQRRMVAETMLKLDDQHEEKTSDAARAKI
ncbi:MAG: hypothetical protein M1823_004623 [Watsoniomyces obsoletus]|nr:MAG: hypothetical protein M1823_004623 [Watsoniomyces obsoletus]